MLKAMGLRPLSFAFACPFSPRGRCPTGRMGGQNSLKKISTTKYLLQKSSKQEYFSIYRFSVKLIVLELL